MIDSDIKRHISLDFNKREATFTMIVPLEGLLSNEESWNTFGNIAKADKPIADILVAMSDMVRKAQR